MAPSKTKAGGMKQGTLFSFFSKKNPQPNACSTSKPLVQAASESSQTIVPPVLSSQNRAKISEEKANLLRQVRVGGRVEVYWSSDDEWYSALVQDQRASTFHLKYEADGQCEWIDLSNETFRLAAHQHETKKKRRIHESEDDEENEFEMPESSEEESSSEFEDPGNGNNDEEMESDFIVSDSDDDPIPKSKRHRANKTPSFVPTKLKSTPRSNGSTSRLSLDRFTAGSVVVTQHFASSEGKTPLSSSSSFSSATRKSVITPTTISKSQSNCHSIQHITTCAINDRKKSSTPFVEGEVNPAGSHVHNHLRFLQDPRDSNGRKPDHPDYNSRTLKVVLSDWRDIMKSKNMTDAVKQWWDLKSEYFDTVLLFKTGKFYEMFHMDADIGVQVCGLTYMKGHVAHAGFPEISYGTMADKLVRAGYKVARVEQTETPEQLKLRKKKSKTGAPKVGNVVNREVCSIVTRGTRTFCYLDDKKAILEEPESNIGPLMAICEMLLESNEKSVENESREHIEPVCEYGITLIDAVRGSVTIGQFADDVLRSRMMTLLATFRPSEILLEGGKDGASPTLLSLIRGLQISAQQNYVIETIRPVESFPKSTALDSNIRKHLERGTGKDVLQVHPWDVQETLKELHRRKYYPCASKKNGGLFSVERWPQVLKVAVEGKAELALSSFGAALYYLQRNLIDGELLSLGVVKAYIPPESPVAPEQISGIHHLATQQCLQEAGLADFIETTDIGLDDSAQAESSITHMSLCGTTLHNLEVLTNSVDHKVAGSLWSKINHTKTAHGSRLLRAWLLRPLFRKMDIDRRADAVQELVSGSAAVALQEARNILSKCGDFERLLSRVHGMSGNSLPGEEGVHPNDRAVLYETATYTKRKVGDFSKLLNSLYSAKDIPVIFEGIEIESPLLKKIVRYVDQGGCYPDMADELQVFFDNFDCDKAAKGLFEPNHGIDDLYDEACASIQQISQELEDYKKEMCNKLRGNAKASWNYSNTMPQSKDKYLIELSASIKVPDDFIVKGKRGTGQKQINKYRTPIVERLVQQLEKAYDLQSDRKRKGMELIFAKFDSKRAIWAAAAQATAILDALGSLAKTAAKSGYTRPRILECPLENSPSIKIVQGRHPCVEDTFKSSEFIPNDLHLGCAMVDTSSSPRVLLLSGPNMGGKSTLLRQTCLITILAQMGSFVPANYCELTPIDCIFTRLGASDAILKGQSTFFVELAETASALRGASRRSLVIMDELGRGTSTFDGTAIASAAVQHLIERSKCLCLFATHYHSLLDEWKESKNVFLGHMECLVENDTDNDDNIVFLYTLGRGVCPKSFGINVARMAGLPHDVLVKAKHISTKFEQEMISASWHATKLSAVAKQQEIRQAIHDGDWDKLESIQQALSR